MDIFDRWKDLSDEVLLSWRIKDLHLKIPGSDLEPCVLQLYAELTAKGIRFHPDCYLTSEWLCPDKVPLIGVPFCLAHPRIKLLEKKIMLEVEGGTEKTCMMLLRHEMGHAINYAYKLYRRTRWRDLFGPFSLPYDEHDYYPRPYSKKFVVHLPDNYAQAHPDEDFAETFAVWLTPNSNWRTRYKKWDALKKIEYIDHVMKEIGSQPPLVSGGESLWPAHKSKSTLATYFDRKKKQFADAYPGYYDPELKKLFAVNGQSNNEFAHTFLQRHHRYLVNTVSRWTRARKYTVAELVKQLTGRTRELGMQLKSDEQSSLNDLCICVTSLVCGQRDMRAAKNEGNE